LRSNKSNMNLTCQKTSLLAVYAIMHVCVRVSIMHMCTCQYPRLSLHVYET